MCSITHLIQSFSMRSTIHPKQSSRSEGSFVERSSVEALQISHISENTPDNLNNFISLCPIGIGFHLAWSPQCALQFIPYNRLDPRASSQTVLDSRSFKLAKLAKIRIVRKWATLWKIW